MIQVEDTARSDWLRASRVFVWLTIVMSSALTSCSPETAATENRFLELERLAFVSAGTTELSGAGTPRVARPLLVDRFEVTGAEWRRWLEDSPSEASEYPVERAEAKDSLPAVFMDFREAQAFANSRGMRLPTAAEWFFVAMGPRGQNWPWDQYEAQAVSNTQEVGLASASPVGVFEQGKTPQGVYDLIGNGWEWVDGTIPEGSEASSEFSWCAGGSYKFPRRALYLTTAGFNIQSLHREHRSSDVGLRCVADAELLLKSYASLPLEGAGVREGVRRTGRRWGRSAIPLLTRLRNSSAPDSLYAVLLSGAAE